MPLMQLRTSDDAYSLTRLDWGAIDAGTTAPALGCLLWNDKPTQVTGELLGTGNGVTTSFAAAHKPFVISSGVTMSVSCDGVAASGWVYDAVNGIVTFSSPPASGVAVTMSYWYSVGTTDATSVILAVEQVGAWAGDGATRLFTLPTTCVTALVVRVGSTILAESEYEIQSNGTKLYLATAPAANVSILIYYIDAVCQGGYYEARSNGIRNPFSLTGFTDDAESSFYKLGGLFSKTNYLFGTGDGTTKTFDMGTPLIRSVTTVTVGGTATTDYTLNNITGAITFTTAPASAAEVRGTWSYERGHKIGAIKEWTARRIYTRLSLPYDAVNAELSTRIRVYAQ